MRISELTTDWHPLMIKDLELKIEECRKMIREIEIEVLTAPLTDEDEYLRYVQLDALVFLIKAFEMKINHSKFLYN
jgi:NifB/MoaA-like Fe-S oxidoreductase